VSWASYERRLPEYVNYAATWGNRRGRGRYHKRQLQRARRRYWRELVQRGFWRAEGGVEPHPRSPANYESEVNRRAH